MKSPPQELRDDASTRAAARDTRATQWIQFSDACRDRQRARELAARAANSRTSSDGRQALARALYATQRCCQNGAAPVADVLWTILRAAIAITNADRGNVQVVEQNGGLRIAAQSGFDRAFLDHFGLVDSDACACGTAMNAGQRVVVADVEHSPIFSGASRAAMLDADARAVQSTPVLDRTGRVIAMVSTHFRVPHQPTPDQLQLLDILVRAAALALRVGA